ncbi:MAG: hypothetical protein KC910_07720 [Candidatus Eremiobacteraeota bacterium]|nr:hypothetical protein [Candidatus Eremiobacteraeota bacterium]
MSASAGQGPIVSTPFDKFLKVRHYRLEVDRAGHIEQFEGHFLHGPGHNVAAVAALVFDAQQKPHVLLKTGDTRAARAERGADYVQLGYIAGRLDKQGAGVDKIALAETAEEVGGEVVEGTFLGLSTFLSPTMPNESTEADAYYLAAVALTGQPSGDGGGMELLGLIGPYTAEAQSGLASMDRGEVSEGGRARTLYSRAFDKIGFVPALGVYVHDHPQLLARFDSLGLGRPVDIRAHIHGARIPPPVVASQALEARVNAVEFVERSEVRLENQTMVDATTRHAVLEDGRLTPVGPAFLNQFQKLDYDRAKAVVYRLDPERGPLVAMSPVERPVLAVKGLLGQALTQENTDLVRLDVGDFEVPRHGSVQAEVERRLGLACRPLGQPVSASSGQSDLYYHFFAAQVGADDPDVFLPLSEAIRLCRHGQADAHTEALLQRLAAELEWLPTLGLALPQARAML